MSTLWAGCWASSHFDNNRYIWAYRDYLIKSFNSNKPFDQFAKEQIAGDLLRRLAAVLGSVSFPWWCIFPSA